MSVFSTATYFDVNQDPTKLEEMLLHSKGIRKVPVIIEGEKVSIGYGGA
jgi:glutaredoxin